MDKAPILTQLEQDGVVVSLEEIAERPFLEKVIATAELLGISRGHAILFYRFADDGNVGNSIVLTRPEQVIGENAKLILAFFKYLDAATTCDWQRYAFAAANVDRRSGAKANYIVNKAAKTSHLYSWGDVSDAGALVAHIATDGRAVEAYANLGSVCWSSHCAASEIQGYKILAAQGKPLFFLPLFGFKSIEALREYAA
jgi:hypothetical protein